MSQNSATIWQFLLLILFHHNECLTTVEQPQDHYVMYGDIQLACPLLRVSSTSAFTWFNADSDMPVTAQGLVPPGVPYVDPQRGTLHIHQPKEKYEYRFYCNTTTEISGIMRTGRSFLEERFVEWPKDVSVTVGEPVTLRCVPPDGMPQPKLMWLHNNRTLVARSQMDLRISHVLPVHQGYYKCAAYNDAFVRESPEAHLEVLEKVVPREAHRPDSQSSAVALVVREGNTVELQCPLRLPENATLNWLPSKPSPELQQRTRIQGTALIVQRVRLSDAGEFVCTVQPSRVRAVVHLTVEAPPTLLQTPEDQRVPQGSSVLFPCVVTGFPTPMIYWDLAHGVSLFPQHDHVFRTSTFHLHPDGRLEARNVGPWVTGKYQCNAHSPLGAASSSANLYVTTEHVQMHPVIQEAPQNLTITRGSTVTLTCSALGTPEPQITWHKLTSQGGVLQALRLDGHPFLRTTATTLQILDVETSYSGNYTCRAQSGLLITTWNFSLKVVNHGQEESGAPPLAPENLRVLTVTPHSIGLAWNISSAYSSSEVLWFRVEMEEMDSDKGWHVVEPGCSTSYFLMENLESNREYRFVVRAVSRFGVSPACGPTYNIRTAGLPTPGSNAEEDGGSNLNDLMRLLRGVSVEQVELAPISPTKFRIDWTARGRIAALKAVSGYKLTIRALTLPHCLPQLRASSLQGGESARYCSVFHGTSMESLLGQWREASLPASFHTNFTRHFSTEDTVESSQSSDMIQVDQQTTVVKTARAFHCYSVLVQPYSHPIPQLGQLFGAQSQQEARVLTDEDVPTEAPQNITAWWVSNSSARVWWHAPPSAHWNGVLQAYLIYVFHARTEQLYTRHVAANTTHILLTQLNSSRDYVLHMAAQNCKGVGVRSGAVYLPVAAATKASPNGSDEALSSNSPSVVREAWFIVVLVLGGAAWFLLSIFILYICCLRSSTSENKKSTVRLAFHRYREVLTASPEHRSPPPLPSPMKFPPVDGGIYATSAFTTTEHGRLASNSIPAGAASPYASTSIVQGGKLYPNPHCSYPFYTPPEAEHPPQPPAMAFCFVPPHPPRFSSLQPGGRVPPQLLHDLYSLYSDGVNQGTPPQPVPTYPHHFQNPTTIQETHQGLPQQLRSGASTPNASFYSPPMSQASENILPETMIVEGDNKLLSRYHRTAHMDGCGEDAPLVANGGLSPGETEIVRPIARRQVPAVEELSHEAAAGLAAEDDADHDSISAEVMAAQRKSIAEPMNARRSQLLMGVDPSDTHTQAGSSNRPRHRKHRSHLKGDREPPPPADGKKSRRLRVRGRKSAPHLDESLLRNAPFV